MYRLNRSCGCQSRNRLDPRVLRSIEAERNSSVQDSGCHGSSETASDVGNCGCAGNDFTHAGEFDYSLAMVYSPYQHFQNLYCEEEGFVAGTIFKELDKPFYGPKCKGGICNE